MRGARAARSHAACVLRAQVFTMKGLEKVPTKLVALALSESPPDSELLGLRNPLLPSAAYDELQSLLVAIRHNIKPGGIVIKARAPVPGTHGVVFV